jgi:membrane protein implicated in regulation of membrane protease activity
MDENQARNRLLVYSAVGFGGLAIFFLGLAIVYTDLARKGGWPQLGALVAILGVVDAMVLPRLLKRTWDKQDREQE